MRSIIIYLILFVAVCLARVIPVKRVDKTRFDTLISFGDSYSDNGSLDDFYKQGGHTDVLNRRTRLSVSAANNGNVTSQHRNNLNSCARKCAHNISTCYKTLSEKEQYDSQSFSAQRQLPCSGFYRYTNREQYMVGEKNRLSLNILW
ncbi:hypothetical protein K501DRAFT_280072 [Backusella circina FSU 941]|nr:hypothetical protein K501DRAFT_280072 [Backusella circina FSU 941]